ncbi:hypothetical protein [Scytonema sp. NUACC21]
MNFGVIRLRQATLRVSSRFKSGNPPNALLTYVDRRSTRSGGQRPLRVCALHTLRERQSLQPGFPRQRASSPDYQCLGLVTSQ